MKIRSTALVKGFRQSAPYVNAHRGKIMVVMIGGEAIADKNFANIISDLALLHSLGVKIVLVHGARPQINQILATQQRTTPYHKGIRITDEEALSLVMQAAGQLQLAITARLSMSLNNTPMAGTQLNVVSGNFVISQPLGVDDGIDYCHSGRIRRIDIEGINQTLDQGSIVLLGPIASSVTGECFNLLSEEVATQVAIRLKADKLIGFCSEQGIIDERGNAIAELFPTEVEALVDRLESTMDSNDDSTGTLRFLRAAVVACRAGVPRSHLISYKEDGALIQELFSFDGIGTQIVMASAEQVRQAQIDDIGGIFDLIRPLEEQGILVRRSREQLEQEIHKFTIIEKDSLLIGCAALYPYSEEGMAEMACVAIHPEYRDGNRGLLLLNHMKTQAKQMGIRHLFVLTTHSLHWFREQGFIEVGVDRLPMAKQSLYNYQRRSKILILSI
ncbi:amino-acid N-acetyltransferase [Vibrio cincinnatiensis]|uniref:Amino-acid acetyltransferase n=1 Tax=Vibrio cincinnatiensis DSM 19608 TaxID=1123491 RepID=A0A1T4N6W6_VIBCI|nr:amino-acid N-acetyltransferase [Vibrio cincinnatiensis]MCG3721152.1 amino-acid N-acetyltransferase [Vibrio cincinnatiensis]MCG3725016.1 amino-acid N-acetyltransferase [Vibrio cincinnatiensis]MCG3731924.1 amino-acid N-acetyltransferase [Vibrio cincinnatiensis]MCG3739318.1 amino-acid N-acetyltransferase [Vibrio cincinnatiensis]MCG3743259.1 amino-acid N-acetyltransferase [Vibrio cincinnatiensis]